MSNAHDKPRSVAYAAHLWNVSEPTVRNWCSKGQLAKSPDGKILGVTRAKVIKATNVPNLLRKQHDQTVDTRELEKLVDRAGVHAVDDRYLDAILAVPRPEERPERKRAAIDTYLRQRQTPSDLPPWMWDEPECPRFEPPVGVFRVRVGPPIHKDFQVWRQVDQSAGYEGSEGPGPYKSVAACSDRLTDEQVANRQRDIDAANAEYDEMEAAWRGSWIRHRRC